MLLTISALYKFCHVPRTNRYKIRKIAECFYFYILIKNRSMMKEGNKSTDSRFIFAIVLIVVGVLWALKRLGINFEIWRFFADHIFHPLRYFFRHLSHILFSWPMVFLMVGVVLLAGKRSFGWVLLVIGCIFLTPRILGLPDLSFSLLLPVGLIVFGAVMVMRSL